MSATEISQLRTELEKTRHHLDATAGAQLAMMSAMALLLSPHKGNLATAHYLRDEKNRVHAALLGSSSTDYKIHAFEETMDSLIQAIES